MKHAFRQRSARAVYEAHSGPNMTPMVDVVMVILIFFMASAAMLGPEWFLKAALPVTVKGTPNRPPVRLSLRLAPGSEGSAHAHISIDGDPERDLPLDQARSFLEMQHKAAGERLLVLITPDPAVNYDDVVRVHEWCAAIGIGQVGLMGASK